MAKYCPVIDAKVVYLECQECEEKLCNKTSVFNEKKAFLIKKKARKKQKNAVPY